MDTRTKSLRNSKRRLVFKRALIYTFLMFLVFLCLFSFYVLIINTTRANAEIQKGFSFFPGNNFMNNLTNLLADDNVPILKALRNSVVIAFLTAILTTYFSAMTAYGIHMYDFRFKRAIFIFIMVVMMVPAQVSTFGFVQLVTDFKMMDTYYPLILPSIASPVVFFFMKQYLDSVLPHEIVESARVDGANELYTFHRIILPIMKPAIAVQFIFSFVGSWNNFFLPALIIQSGTKKTIPLLIAGLKASDPTTFDLGLVYILIAMAIIPLIIIYLILSRFIIKGVTLGSVKG